MSVPTGAGNYPAGVTDNDPYFTDESEPDDEEEPLEPCTVPPLVAPPLRSLSEVAAEADDQRFNDYWDDWGFKNTVPDATRDALKTICRFWFGRGQVYEVARLMKHRRIAEIELEGQRW